MILLLQSGEGTGKEEKEGGVRRPRMRSGRRERVRGSGARGGLARRSSGGAHSNRGERKSRHRPAPAEERGVD
ncbi:unnamed protein product, partial [Brenthis ino]